MAEKDIKTDFRTATISDSSGLEKHLILSIEDYEIGKIPNGLKNVEGFIKRKGITNPAVVINGDKITLLARLIFEDSRGDNSAIVKYDGVYKNGLPFIFKETEKVVFSPSMPFASRGAEDFRIANVSREIPYHGFVVEHDGIDARTKYLRTSPQDPFDLTRWEDDHGIWIPNIKVKEAIEISGDREYSEFWAKAHSKNNFLPTKDCSLWPKKIKRKTLEGEEEFYGVITRLLPDMQIVYINNFDELANEDFWRNTIRNIKEHSLLKRKHTWEASHIGLAGQPVITDEGVLVFYHGAVMQPERIYRFGAALADKNEPQKIMARTSEPILEPTESWEMREGVISGKVVFPTAHFLRGNRVAHFYGASDDCIGYCEMPLSYIYDRMDFSPRNAKL
jgi:predicted GH43/DUF377 family glycosyl hydrolase